MKIAVTYTCAHMSFWQFVIGAFTWHVLLTTFRSHCLFQEIPDPRIWADLKESCGSESVSRSVCSARNWPRCWWAEPTSDRKQYDDADAMCHARKQINQRAPLTSCRPSLSEWVANDSHRRLANCSRSNIDSVASPGESLFLNLNFAVPF